MEMLSLFIVVVFLGVICWSVSKTSVFRYFYLTTKFPGPSLLELVSNKSMVGDDMLSYVYRFCESYGHKLWGFWAYSDFVIVVSDCDLVMDVYRSKGMTDKPTMIYKALTEYFGYGLFSLSTGNRYKQHRRIMEPAFRRKFVEMNLLSHTNYGGTRIVEELQKIADGKSVLIQTLLENKLIELSFWTVTSGTYQHPNAGFFRKVTKSSLRYAQLKTLNPIYYWFVQKWKKQSRKRETEIAVEYAALKDTFLELVRVVTRKMNDEIDWQPSNPFELMIHENNNGDSLSEDELFDEFRTLVIALFETTSFMVNICLLLLALHQDAQQRVSEEIDVVFGDRDRQVEIEDLTQLPFLHQVYKEALRLFPPGPLIARKVCKETIIDKMTLPKGSTVIINIMALHRNPKVFKDPLKFDPERFSSGILEKQNPFAYIPFSFGGRNCPGQLVALVAVKTLLCHILRNFKVLPGEGFENLEDIKVKMSITMNLQRPIPLRLISRKSDFLGGFDKKDVPSCTSC